MESRRYALETSDAVQAQVGRPKASASTAGSSSSLHTRAKTVDEVGTCFWRDDSLTFTVLLLLLKQLEQSALRG